MNIINYPSFTCVIYRLIQNARVQICVLLDIHSPVIDNILLCGAFNKQYIYFQVMGGFLVFKKIRANHKKILGSILFFIFGVFKINQ